MQLIPTSSLRGIPAGNNYTQHRPAGAARLHNDMCLDPGGRTAAAIRDDSSIALQCSCVRASDTSIHNDFALVRTSQERRRVVVPICTRTYIRAEYNNSCDGRSPESDDLLAILLLDGSSVSFGVTGSMHQIKYSFSP
jgi:hypothetical protein